ncbi:MAG: sensor histidine kinase [Bacteroidota bacterium]
MRYSACLIFIAGLTVAGFSQKGKIAKHLINLEFDSAWATSQALKDAKERAFFFNLTTILRHGGQRKEDSVLVANLIPGTKDPYDQFLLGNFHLYNGERGEALKLLLQSLNAFKESEDALLALNYLSILHLYSRIMLSEKFIDYLNEFKTIATEQPYLNAWHLNYLLKYYSKVLNTETVAEDYHETYEVARRFFKRSHLNNRLLAHFHEKEAVYFRWIEEYDNALMSFKKTVAYAEDHDHLRFLKFTALVELAGMQIKMGDMVSAKANIDRARTQWDRSDPILTDLNFNIMMAINYYETIGKWDSAYFLIKEIFGKQLSDFIANNNVRVSELEEEFNVEIKDAEILNQEQLIANQQVFLIVLISLLVVLVTLSVLLIYAFRNIRRKNEKIETLMRELHHRVKNNLQIISSLLGLQSLKLQDEKAKKAVIEGKGRIRAMSLIHQKLYQTDDIAILNFEEYLVNLTDEIATSYGYQQKVTILISVTEKTLDTDTTLPIGLIVNELVSNAFKYAFKKVESPKLSITLQHGNLPRTTKDDRLELIISDNGSGLPDSFDLKKADSFGLKLVNLLTLQIKGVIEYRSDLKGTTFKVHFPNRSRTIES